MLAGVPVTVQAFGQQFPGDQFDTALNNLTRFCLSFREQPRRFQEKHDGFFAALALLLLTLTGLRESERNRRAGGGLPGDWQAEIDQHDCGAICKRLFQDPAVRSAVNRLYRLTTTRVLMKISTKTEVAEGPSAPNPGTHWRSMRLTTLQFYEHGTTSLILKVNLAGNRPPAALKLILYPFVGITSIAESTRKYASTYSLAGSTSTSVVRVHASTSTWILMDFVPGPTLAMLLGQKYASFAPQGSPLTELHRRPSAGPDKTTELDNLQQLGNALFEALKDLQSDLTSAAREKGQNVVHADLTPSNIIVNDIGHQSYHFVLVDLGANHLYTRAISGLEGAESVFVAPEVRRASPSLGRADLFSIGQLLIACAGMRPTTEGIVPDAMYARYPLLARLFEDLIDREPQQRLIVAGAECSNYEKLRVTFNQEVDAMRALRSHVPRSGESTLTIVRELFRPLSGEPLAQFKLWWAMRRQRDELGQPLQEHVTWLFLCSWLAAAVSTIAIVAVTWWGWRDLGWDWGNRLVEVLQHTTGRLGTFPFVDQLANPGYEVANPANWPARIVCFTYALVGMKLYQSVYARMAPMAAGWHSGLYNVSSRRRCSLDAVSSTG